MRQFWDQLTTSQKRTVTAGLVFAGVVLLSQFIVVPYFDARQKVRSAIVAGEKTLRELAAMGVEYGVLRQRSEEIRRASERRPGTGGRWCNGMARKRLAKRRLLGKIECGARICSAVHVLPQAARPRARWHAPCGWHECPMGLLPTTWVFAMNAEFPRSVPVSAGSMHPSPFLEADGCSCNARRRHGTDARWSCAVSWFLWP